MSLIRFCFSSSERVAVERRRRRVGIHNGAVRRVNEQLDRLVAGEHLPVDFPAFTQGGGLLPAGFQRGGAARLLHRIAQRPPQQFTAQPLRDQRVLGAGLAHPPRERRVARAQQHDHRHARCLRA